MKIGQAPRNGSILLTNARRHYPEAALDRSREIYELDCRTGETRLLVSAEEIASRKIQGGRPLHRADTDIVHLQYSPPGNRVAFLPDTDHVGIVNADGSGVEFSAGKKPMHFQWFDDESVFGHTDVGPETSGPGNPFCNDSPEDGKLYRWDLTERAQVERLAGYGCHPAASPDRELYATEDWYTSEEITLRLYERGDDIPTAELFTTGHSRIVWGSQAHVNPAFSRDGSRIYYTKPAGSNTVQLCDTEVADLLG